MSSLEDHAGTRRGRFLVALLVLFALSGRNELARAQENAQSASPWQPLEQSMQICRQTGRLLVVVTSSKKEPASKAFVTSFKMVVNEAAGDLDLMFSEMPAEQFAFALKQMRVTSHPTVILYRPGPRDVQFLASRSDLKSVRETVLWLDSIGGTQVHVGNRIRLLDGSRIGSAGFAPAARKNHAGTRVGGFASRSGNPKVELAGALRFGAESLSVGAGQSSLPSATSEDSSPTASDGPAGSAARRPATLPVSAIPAAAGLHGAGLDSAGRLAPIGSHGHPAPAPTVVVGPTPQPNIIFASAPPSAPTISYMPAANAPQPTANAPQLFMAPAPQPQPTANAPQPPVAMAPPAQMAYAPQPMAMAPQPAQPAYAPQQAQVAQSPALLAAVLTNPSLVNRLLGALGEHLAQRKNPPLQMGQAPQMMQAPVAAAPIGGAPDGSPGVCAGRLWLRLCSPHVHGRSSRWHASRLWLRIWIRLRSAAGPGVWPASGLSALSRPKVRGRVITRRLHPPSSPRPRAPVHRGLAITTARRARSHPPCRQRASPRARASLVVSSRRDRDSRRSGWVSSSLPASSPGRRGSSATLSAGTEEPGVLPSAWPVGQPR